MSDLNVDGMVLAPGVAETIVSIAVSEIEGVASVGTTAAAKGGIMGLVSSKTAQGIDIQSTEDGKLAITVHIDVQYGYSLPKVAAEIRQAVADAVLVQVGTEVENVDVYIDGIQFAK